MSTITGINSKADLSAYLSALPPSKVVAIYFYTPWTDFSTTMSIDMSALASQYPITDPLIISFAKINGKKLVDIAKEYSVPKAPWVVLLQGDQVLESIRGFDTTVVRDALDRHLGADARSLAVRSEDPVQLNEALIARLTGLVNSAPVMLFMKGSPGAPQCRFSRRLVETLQERGINFEHFDILTDEAVRQGLKEFADWPTFPQLWVDGVLIGGLEIVRDRTGEDRSFLTKYSIGKEVESGEPSA